MSKIDDVKVKLTELGISFDEEAKLKELQALLPEESNDESSSDEIVVRDPQILRPKTLPLVVILPKDASKAQLAFAKVLNAYAYKNPEKFAAKKNDRTVNGVVIKGLITKLKELKDAPDPVEEEDGGLQYKNQLLGGTK